jgi:hypothetical protein
LPWRHFSPLLRGPRQNAIVTPGKMAAIIELIELRHTSQQPVECLLIMGFVEIACTRTSMQ